MKHINYLLFAALMALFVACEEKETSSIRQAELTIVMQLPEMSNARLSDASVSITNTNTQNGMQTKATIVDGNRIVITADRNNLYSISVDANVEYEKDGITLRERIRGRKENITVTDETMTIEIPMFIVQEQEGFVLAEIFCAGTSTPQGTYYYADKYFVVYNNSDHVLYADSLLLMESEFLTNMKQDYEPNIMNNFFAAGAIYMIPGSGHDYPVQPGGKLLLVDNAIDHTYANPLSWDFSAADFEWYDESTNPRFSDIDNPNVVNMQRIYCYSPTLWSPHTQGFKSYAIGTMKTDANTFLSDYYYDYKYQLVVADFVADMSGTCYKVPNEWIIDAVNMSSKMGYQWIVTSPQLDQGYTYNSEFDFDDTRFHKSVRRKVARRDGNRAILQDTNNSSEDFEPRVAADPFHVF